METRHITLHGINTYMCICVCLLKRKYLNYLQLANYKKEYQFIALIKQKWKNN